MVFNGEIYNYRDLGAKYNLKTKTTGDSEVIIELFALHGPEIIKELNGMFSIVIWDTFEDRLSVFRDRFGVKPFFYYWDGTTFIFGSELKAIKSCNQVSLEVNKGMLGYYLNLGFIPFPHTVFHKVYKLPPGYYLQLKEGVLRQEEFISLTDFVNKKTEDIEEEVVGKLDSLLTASVKRQIISDVPLGVFLSGGTDSSLITALTKEVSVGKVKTFSVGFSNSLFDELPFAAKVAKYLNTDHHEIVISDTQMLDNLFNIIEAYDEPYIIAAGFPAFSISEFTRRHVTVALSGEGADEIFMGYGFHMWAKKMEQFPLKPFSGLIASGLKLSSKPSHQQKARLFKKPVKGPLQNHIFSQEQFYFSYDEIHRHFAPEVNAMGPSQIDLAFPEARPFNAEEKQSWFDINRYLVDDLLTKVDRASMNYGLEARVPFLDNDLFAYAININSRLKLNGENGKYILKKVLNKYIPQEYFNRPKWGFAPPLSRWLKGELKQVVDQYLSADMINKFGVVTPAYVNGLRKEYENGNDRVFNKIWLLTLLHIWLYRNAQ